jgi:ribosomal RNA-processing protein 9
MSSFFTLPASRRKRKREDRTIAPASKKRGMATNGDLQTTDRGKKRRDRDESISGSESEDDEGQKLNNDSLGDESTSESEDGETAAERRLRLAERYLENIKGEVDEAGFDAAEIDRDMIAERLKEEVV